MGGEIGIATSGSNGTTVRVAVKLPVVCIERRDQGKLETNPAEELDRYIENLGRPLSILIADDNPTNRIVASKLLQGRNVKINMAADGAEAVSSARLFSTDLILMDMRMPEMDGLEATRALRQGGSKVPIIAFTANAFQDDAAAAKAAGMDGFVAKPVRKPVLLAAIVEALTNAKHGDQPHENSSNKAADPGLPSSPTLFDEAEYDVLMDSIGLEAVEEALQVFVSDTTTALQALKNCEFRSSRQSIGRDAHSIKGAAATFGLKALSATAMLLERNADGIDNQAFTQICSQLEKDFAQGLAMLRAPRALQAA
jgi:CheY-like chemotaxis protein/HPt (histidine-containing phosphotransfer) domain-containing protein